MGLVQNTAPPPAQWGTGSRQAYSYKINQITGSKHGGPKH